MGLAEETESTPQRRASTATIVSPIGVPDELASLLADAHGGLDSTPVADSVDEIVFYLDRATQWHIRRRSQGNNHICKLANVARAHWLLRAVQGGSMYTQATNQTSFHDFQQDLDVYGMTLPRFFSQLEKVRENNDNGQCLSHTGRQH